MIKYIKILFSALDDSTKEMLIAKLSVIGYDGFEEHNNDLLAYITDDKFDTIALSKITEELDQAYEKLEIPATNWNQVWESNYSPVIVEDYCGIRASPHPTTTTVKHEIIITPKMSFGTGHHATTNMMIQMMRGIDFSNKTVLDFGTGTGVLSILAEKEEARVIIAIDNDPWSVENANENIQMNHCSKIHIALTEKIPTTIFDVILANINMNVIIENLAALSENLKQDGILLVSGLLETDEQDVLSAFETNDLHIDKKINKAGWMCLFCCH